MNPDEIKLENVNKLFEYEKHSRTIDSLNIDELKTFAKLYCKLYLKQQETLSSMTSMGLL
jgi:hypothetical protein